MGEDNQIGNKRFLYVTPLDSNGDPASIINPLPIEVIGSAIEVGTINDPIFTSNIEKVDSEAVDVGEGAADVGTQRVAVAGLAEALLAEAGVPTKGLQVMGDNGAGSEFLQIEEVTKGLKVHVVGRESLTNAFAQLTAPGSTESFACLPCIHHMVQAVAADVDTNAVLRAEGSLDDTNWFNLSEDLTVTEDGAYWFAFLGPLAYVRLTFVSEEGGTGATVDASYLGGM